MYNTNTLVNGGRDRCLQNTSHGAYKEEKNGRRSVLVSRRRSTGARTKKKRYRYI